MAKFSVSVRPYKCGARANAKGGAQRLASHGKARAFLFQDEGTSLRETADSKQVG